MSNIIVDEAKGTLTITDVTITFPYGSAPTQTRVGTIIITPAGGVASFPMATQGSSGLPPDIDITPHPVEPTDPLPSPAIVKTVLDPGGPGEAAHYRYDWWYHKGDKGDAASFNFLDADDLDTSGLDELANGYVLSYVNDGVGTPGVVFIPQRRAELKIPGAFPATGWSATSPRLLTTVTLAPSSSPSLVLCSGWCPVTGSVDTRVDLVARLGDPDTGFELARGVGVAGVAPPAPTLQWAPPLGSNVAHAIIPAGAAANIYLRAEQQAASGNSWSTGEGRFGIVRIPA